MGVMEDVPGEMGYLGQYLASYFTVSRRRCQHLEFGRAEQGGGYEAPRCTRSPRLPHDAWVGGYAKEFVENGPRRIPGFGARPLSFQPTEAGGVEG